MYWEQGKNDNAARDRPRHSRALRGGVVPLRQMTDLHQWLRGIGLDRYADLFVQNDIDQETLLDLRDEEFEKLGVTLGHRKKLIKAAAQYGAEAPQASGRADDLRPRDGSADAKAERRHLTVLMCDIVGSTALTARLDPEDAREILLQFQGRCGEAVRRYDGHVARFMGDGLLAYFGFPAAHEDDAERGVNAALEMLSAVSALADPAGRRIELRIGIATGLVVVGDRIGEGPSREFALVGDAANLAAHLQKLAEPNQILLAPGTQRLLGRRFELEDTGDHAIKGVDTPVRVWRVIEPRPVESRFEARQSSYLTPFVGRDSELELLLTRYDLVKRGEGQVVLVSGEAGIGKSRLALALKQRLAAETGCRLEFQCSPYHASSAWFPVIRHLEEAAGIGRDTPPDQRLEKLDALVEQHLKKDIDGVVPILAALMSIPTGSRYPPLDLVPSQQKNRTFAALLALLRARTEEHAGILVFEDVHWIDPTSLELLERLRDQVRRWRMLVVVLSRPELTLPWAGQPHIGSLMLSRLERGQVVSMIASLAETGALAQATRDEIVSKTDGVPLFIEEVTKAVLESAQRATDAGDATGGTPAAIAVPDTLHESLMARLDQLAPMKVVAQMAAVIGREFSLDILEAIAPLPKRDLRAAIDRLLSSGLLFRSGPLARESFTFKHALVQDEAYASLLRAERRTLHRKIADVLVANLSTVGEGGAEIVAHHYTQAGDSRIAIDYWLKAAQQASGRSAFVEASRHLKAALDLLAELPATRERDALELKLQTSRGSALAQGRGFGADETSQAFRRAIELFDRFEPSAQVFSVLNGLIGVYVARGEFEQSRDLAVDLLARAGQRNDSTARLMGHRALGMSLFLIGELPSARDHLQKSLELYDVTLHGPLALVFSQDFKVSAQAYMGLASVLFGDINSALENGRAAVAHADQLRHPHSICYALTFLAGALLLSRNPQPVYPLIERSMRLADEYGFPLWTAAGQMLGGWTRLELGDAPQALIEIRRSLEALEATGALIWVHFARYLLAAALFKANRTQEAIEELDQDLAKIAGTSGRWYEAELHRIKGGLLLARGEPDAAEACYLKAVAIATRQGARLWQLRAENDFASMRRIQGRFAEVRARLAPLYASFGNETAYPDVADAGHLLADIAPH